MNLRKTLILGDIEEMQGKKKRAKERLEIAERTIKTLDMRIRDKKKLLE